MSILAMHGLVCFASLDEGQAQLREAATFFNRAEPQFRAALDLPVDDVAGALHDLAAACEAATLQLQLDAAA